MYWKKYSELIHADFIERKYWHSPKAAYNYKGYRIIFDHYSMRATVDTNSYESVLTRIYCQFVSPKRINLKIHKATLINRILSVFRNDRVKVNDAAFDAKYYLLLNKEVSPLLLNRSIRKKIIDFNVNDLYIDNKEGIWGESLANDSYELATFIDSAKVDYLVLYNLKVLFEEMIDALEINYQIGPVKEL